MAQTPSNWGDKKSLNDWWQRGIDKERARLTNAPKAHKGDKFSVAENFANFAPPVGGKKDARRHR
jgi:hypothetical protein